MYANQEHQHLRDRPKAGMDLSSARAESSGRADE